MNALEKFIESAKTYVDIEKEVALVQEKTISTSNYIGLFRVNRSCQTEEQQIPSIKELQRQLHTLKNDIHDAQAECQSSKSAMMEEVSEAISSYLADEINKLQSKLREAKERIHQSHRTRFGNQIALVKQKYVKERQQQMLVLQTKHDLKMKEINDSIKAAKKKRLFNESQIQKYKMFIEKTTLLARRAGIDVTAYMNETPDTIEQLQMILKGKKETFELAKKKEASKQEAGKMLKAPKVDLKKLQIPKSEPQSQPLQTAVPATPVSVLDQESPLDALPVMPPFTEQQMAQFELQLAQAINKINQDFIIEKKKEELATREMIESFQSQFDALMTETRIVLSEQKSIPIPTFFDITTEMFGKIEHEPKFLPSISSTSSSHS